MRYSSPIRGNEIRFCLLNFPHQACRVKLEDKEILCFLLNFPHQASLLRSLFAGPRFSPHVQAAYCSNTFHSNCLANHSLSTRIRNSSRKNLLIPKQRWRRMIKHCVKSPIISYFYFQRSSKECDSNNN